MIYQIQGKLKTVKDNFIVLINGGVGYGIHVDSMTQKELEREEYVTVIVHHNYTETSQDLFGFIDEHDRDFFRKLISANGIGCLTAILLLSNYNQGQISEAVVRGDTRLFESIKGIAEKKAKSIIKGLKGKLDKI